MKYLISLLFLIYAGVVNTQAQNINVPFDASGMFNERGYYNSNSVSFDEEEAINTFNGNLSYRIPMFQMKGPGEMYLDLSLNYNGSISNQIFASTINHTQFSRLTRYNFNLPGWIFSLNGMAVQMLNFETNFFTYQQTNNTVSGEKVRALVPGYHITDNLEQVSNGTTDEIIIMRGDGSTINLKRYGGPNCSFSGSEENCYIGEYYSRGITEYVRGHLEFIEDGIVPTYRNRRLSLMMGDGLTYIYEETKNSYKDFSGNTGSSQFKPQVFLLKFIKDRFGNTMELVYTNIVNVGLSGNQQVYGRPLLSVINVNWNASSIVFNYQTAVKTAILVNSGDRLFKVLCDNACNFTEFGYHRLNPEKVVNPVQDEIKFTYEKYNRIANNLYNPVSGQKNMQLNFNPQNTDYLKRLKSFENYNNGIREYEYNGSNTLNDTIPQNPI